MIISKTSGPEAEIIMRWPHPGDKEASTELFGNRLDQDTDQHDDDADMVMEDDPDGDEGVKE